MVFWTPCDLSHGVVCILLTETSSSCTFHLSYILRFGSLAKAEGLGPNRPSGQGDSCISGSPEPSVIRVTDVAMAESVKGLN